MYFSKVNWKYEIKYVLTQLKGHNGRECSNIFFYRNLNVKSNCLSTQSSYKIAICKALSKR